MALELLVGLVCFPLGEEGEEGDHVLMLFLAGLKYLQPTRLER